MSDYIKKIKLWFEAMNKRETSYDKTGINPRRDWNILLIAVVIVLLGIGAVAGYFYFKVSNGRLFNVALDAKKSEMTINEKLLNKTLGDVNERKKNFSSLKQGRAAPQDPSI